MDPANSAKCPTAPANRLDLSTAGDDGKLHLVDTNDTLDKFDSHDYTYRIACCRLKILSRMEVRYKCIF